ncbi:MAG: hypothetical protein ACHRXM_19320 [Isosphaerales bacterium]
MIRRSFRRRLEFESLESMLLLSGIAATGHHAAAVLLAKVAQSSSPILLQGTIRGTYQSASALGGVTRFTATGSLTPVGSVTLKGSLNYTLKTPGGTATISTKHGNIKANLSTGAVGSPVIYHITGGTGKYVGASGSGEAIFTTVPIKGKGPAHGKVTITFEAVVA